MATPGNPGPMTPAQFVAKWRPVTLPERAASQEHFIDLCRLLGQPTPAEQDATGAEYTFEKGVPVTEGASAGSKGQRGFADVWWHGKFAWEYKRKDKYKDLAEAYRQLCQYREALGNPPLLIVSDITRTEIHTNFTGTAKQVHVIQLADFAKPEGLALLRRVFTDPASFCPTTRTESVTEDVARHIGAIAQTLRSRGHDPHAAAHFLMKCMFSLFAEDVGLLPERLFSRILDHWHDRPGELRDRMAELFEKMRTGGAFGTDAIPWFNGGLFDDSTALELSDNEVAALRLAARQDWSSVEPAIFGTLFERSLDPDKRAQIGAHYTSRQDIILVVDPVVMAPLRREWQAVVAEVEGLLERRRAAKGNMARRNINNLISRNLQRFQEQLASIRILDPACGSGNFLYVAIQQLLEIEKEVITYAARPEVQLGLLPHVRPAQLHGIEINPYAAELAQVVIWIGYLQWMRDNGFGYPTSPILDRLQTIENRDAILDFVAQTPSSGQAQDFVAQTPSSGQAQDFVAQTPSSGQAQVRAPVPQRTPVPAEWPEADFIIGNPPFLGSKVFRQNGLPDDYVAAMYAAYELPKTSDLCCYWFEQARRAIEKRPATRVGLLATQGIRGGDNRTVLERIKNSGDIFMAWSDRDWILDGANVHVSILGFGAKPVAQTPPSGVVAQTPPSGQAQVRAPVLQGPVLDGRPVCHINADLTSDEDTAKAMVLPENASIAFMGDTKGGAFDITCAEASQILAQPNPNGKPNSVVATPWINGSDITKRDRGMWIIDFGCEMPMQEAAAYEAPFRLVAERVQPQRAKNRRAAYAQRWWIHVEARPAMRQAINRMSRFGITCRVSKHRVFEWRQNPTLPDSATFVFARSDDYFFGVLHSSIHEVWARRMGTQLREVESGFRYTPTTCFETFPLPWPPGNEPVAQTPSSGAVAQTPPSGAVAQTPSSGQPQVRAPVPQLVAQMPSSGPVVPAQPGAPVMYAKPSRDIYRRNLPHIQAPERPIFITFCTLDRWALPPSVRGTVMQHCLHDNGSKIHMHGLVVMPDHVHLILSLLRDSRGSIFGLAEVMKGIKGASSHTINKALGRKGCLWQDESYDHVLRSEESLREAVEYICNNPVRKGLVQKVEDWPWLWREWVEGVAQTPSSGAVAQTPSSGQPQVRAPVPQLVAQMPSSGPVVPAQPGAAVLQRITEAARELNDQRERWLNPPEWIGPIAQGVDAADKFADVPEEARPLIRQSFIMAAAAKDPRLRKRTLTNLYNERPTWLRLAHEKLDRSVLAAYAAVDPEGAWSEDWAEVWRDTGAGQPLPDGHPMAARRVGIDQKVLANLLRLNLARAAGA